MHVLEAVTGIGERAPDDDGHGVVEIRPLHLVFDIDGNEIRCAGTGRTGRSVAAVAAEGKEWVLIVCHNFFLGPGVTPRGLNAGVTGDLSL
jgi:hypothetical protein